MEQNASDNRNKKSIEMQVSGLLSNQQVNKFFTTNDQGIFSNKSKTTIILSAN